MRKRDLHGGVFLIPFQKPLQAPFYDQPFINRLLHLHLLPMQ